MKVHLTFLLFILSAYFSLAQNLSAYSDYKKYFFAFDDGITKELEYQGISSYKVGGNSIAYVDNADNFKVYFNGSSNILLDSHPSDFYATDDLVVYFKNMILDVFDNGQVNTISKHTGNYIVGDSIVGFFDLTSSTFKAYYNGQLKDIESLRDQPAFSNFKAGDNLLAYVNYDDHFKVFYHAEVFELENNPPTSYKAASSTVAYVEGNSQVFKVFYNGITSTLESLAPASYLVADNMVAYVDNSGSFKIFYQGQLFKISSFEPGFYEAEDKVIIFGDKINFNVFYKGKITQMENYIPDEYQKDFNSIAYRDRYGYLKLFVDGQLQQVSREKINSFELSRNVLKFDTGLNILHFFSNGTVVSP